MNRPRPEELQTIVAQGRWDQAVAILQRLDPSVAADTLMGLPYEQQQVLFRRLPPEFAARLAPILPLLPHLCAAPQPLERPND